LKVYIFLVFKADTVVMMDQDINENAPRVAVIGAGFGGLSADRREFGCCGTILRNSGLR